MRCCPSAPWEAEPPLLALSRAGDPENGPVIVVKTANFAASDHDCRVSSMLVALDYFRQLVNYGEDE